MIRTQFYANRGIYDVVKNFFEQLPTVSEEIVRAIGDAETLSLQTSYTKSIYATLLGDYCESGAKKMTQLADEYSPEQLRGAGRQHIKHFEGAQKRLTFSVNLPSEIPTYPLM